jgi:hypothetical protein
MILINSVMLFITRLYSKKLYTHNYLKSDDYISNVINKNKNSTYNLMNNITNNNYYYDEKKHIFKKNENTTFGGFDMRDNITDNISIYNISVYLYKKNLLDILINENININNKLSFIEEHDKIFNESKYYNIYAGGLMKDWNL